MRLGRELRGTKITPRRIVIGITGAHGVGKTTLALALVNRLRPTHPDVELLPSVGSLVRERGYSVGSAVGPDGIAAVYAAHLERERTAQASVTLLDRCLVDALAHVITSNVSDASHLALYREITIAHGAMLDLVIHLEMSPFFLDKGQEHETPEHRLAIAEAIPDILMEMDVPYATVDASGPGAVTQALDRILQILPDRTDASPFPDLSRASLG